LLLGNAQYELNRNYEAVHTIYSRILELTPDYQRALNNYLVMLNASSDPKVRITGYRKILHYHPDNFEANYQLGVTYGKMLGKLDTAIVLLEKAAMLQPGNSGALRDLGVAWAMQGEYAASLPWFEKVAALKPDNPDNLINLGITYQHLGMNEKANELFRQAEKLRNQ